MRAAMRQAIETPLSVLEMSIEAMQLAEVAMTGNPNARSDAGGRYPRPVPVRKGLG